jgi:hypothetical protein
MAAKPKLTPAQWADVRNHWENDPREGYSWLVKELGLSVSVPGVRKTASRDGWTKVSPLGDGSSKTGEPKKDVRARKVYGNVSKVSENHRETMRGRPTAYREEFSEQARKLCMLGATDAEMADFFEVNESTINNWKVSRPEFFHSMKEGKSIADATVAESLYKRAIGYSHPDVHIANYQGETVITEITKHYPPDTAAAFIWLKNRRPREWRDKIEIKEDVNLNVFPSKEVLDGIYKRVMAEAAKRDAFLIGRRERLGIVIDAGERDVE